MERQWHLCEDGEASKHTPVMNVCLCSFVAKSGRFAICHVVVVHCGVGWRGRHWHRRFMIIIFGITGSEGSLHKSWSYIKMHVVVHVRLAEPQYDWQSILDFEPQSMLDTSITSNSGYACREYGAESSHLVHMCCNSFGKKWYHHHHVITRTNLMVPCGSDMTFWWTASWSWRASRWCTITKVSLIHGSDMTGELAVPCVSSLHVHMNRKRMAIAIHFYMARLMSTCDVYIDKHAIQRWRTWYVI